MIDGRELTMNDYAGMLRRRWKTILIPALLAPVAAFLVSFAFSPKYTAQAAILVEGQKVPENMVQPIVSEDISQRISTMEQQATSDSRLRPVLQRLYPAKSAQDISAMIDDIRTTVTVVPMPDLAASSTQKRKPGETSVTGFTVNYMANDAQRAQQICSEVTGLILDEHRREVQAAATGTTDVLNRGLEDAKASLDSMDSKLAEFKKKYVGQLPGDEENNLKILMGLNSQLEANTQTLNRAQQDKAYTESMLAQQLATWKSGQSSTNPETLEKQLSDLQSQLIQLQARYTDDHPDVIKAKADIASVKKKLAEVNRASDSTAPDAGNEKASASEPPEIRQLRLQIHQYTDLINSATREQKRYQQEIATYQNRVSLSPAIEEEYKALTRDYDNAQKSYQDLLSKKSAADLTVKMTSQEEGERMYQLGPINVPDTPSFPNRWLFAAAGLGAGLMLGLCLGMGVELMDNSIRNVADAEAALDLPLLVAIPWVGEEEAASNGSAAKLWKGKKEDEVVKI